MNYDELVRFAKWLNKNGMQFMDCHGDEKEVKLEAWITREDVERFNREEAPR